MKCPHCNEILPFILCPECNKEMPEKSRYCCWCGHSITVAEEGGGIDFSQRILCSDGSCVGIINEEGICNICRKPYAGELR